MSEYFEYTLPTGAKVSFLPILELPARLFEETGDWANAHKVNFHLLKNAAKTEKDYQEILNDGVSLGALSTLINEWNKFKNDDVAKPEGK